MPSTLPISLKLLPSSCSFCASCRLCCLFSLAGVCDVRVARLRALGTPRSLLPLPVSLPPGVLGDYRLQMPLFLRGNFEPIDDALVFEPVARVPLLSLPLDLLAGRCSLGLVDDRVHPRLGLSLAPIRVISTQRDYLPLQGPGLYEVAQHHAGDEHPRIALSGRQLVPTAYLEQIP